MWEVQAPRLREQDLAGKVAVVTGATRGIGRAVALQLATRGCSVLGTCSGPDSLILIDSLAHTVSNLYSGHTSPPKVVGVAANITQTDCAQKIVQALEKNFDGHVDILVNNAAHPIRAKIGEIEPQMVTDVMMANVQTPTMIVNEFVKKKMFRTSSRIVNIGSDSARASIPGLPGRSLYTTFKSALEGLARAWADELGANPELEFMKGTTANTVAVGFTETDMVSKMPPLMREAVNQNVLAKQSLGPRAALPEDIADVVGFLCGPDSRWVTGSVVSADGGMVKIM
ncbi:NAD(P)-binding protein [Aureobasidium pullulans]|uniref:3-oxoacyl-[acyl-carrier-protein] reductase n=1 Tax=Aureobasidium pullulans TaxID=5580 RepID=A0A4T0B7S2_AURPU|nr:NAD(P)-binding protein [Aureobasidium pullulans]TIA30190.1 NAD(P)-binding protein [Aureobasidium pullulans]